MRRIFAMLALLGAVTLGAPSWAEEKPAAAGGVSLLMDAFSLLVVR